VRVAVVFDTPYARWTPDEHRRQMERELSGETGAEPEMEYQVGGALIESGHELLLIGMHGDPRALLDHSAEWKPDMVMNCAESFLGNASLDHLSPTLLEAGGYRYTGCAPLALQVTRDKAMSKKILSYHGVRVPGFATYRLGVAALAMPDLRFPLIVKPLETDASGGIAIASVVTDLAGLAERVAFVHERFGQPAIAEEFIDGRELYVGMLGNGESVEILPMTEMVFDKTKNRPEERIATKAAKWDEPYRDRRGVRNVFARRVAQAAQTNIEETCRIAFRAMLLRDYARLDVRLTPEGDVWFLEANANPFISYGHDMANMADKTGLDYQDFIERIVDLATARYGNH
jgi:D-alanine-D-alanine ligase